MDLKEDKWIFTHKENIMDMLTKWIIQWECQQMPWKIWCVLKWCMGMMTTQDVLKQNQLWDTMMDTIWPRMNICKPWSKNSVNLNLCIKAKLIQTFSRRKDNQNQQYKKFKTRKRLLQKHQPSLRLWQVLFWKRKWK
jgi:hypothetical protein